MSDSTCSAINSISEIVFFDTGNAGGIVKDVFKPIAAEAKSRGYDVTYTDNFNLNAEIGFYCEHGYHMPKINSDLSVITFHGLDDSFDSEYYVRENWSQYDIGILPGQVAAENWQSVSWHPHAKPRIGTYRAGWPKADHLFTDEFEALVRTKAEDLGVQSGQTVLYAPTLESDNKAIEFIKSSEHIFDNILLKLAPFDDTNLTKLLDGLDKECQILESNTDIMVALSLADIVVSDQSSVLLEAILTETVPVSVTDWPIRWGESPSYPGETLPDFAIRTNRDELTAILQSIIRNHDTYINKLNKEKNKNFDNLGSGAAAVMDIIEDSVKSETNCSLESVEVKPTQWRPHMGRIKHDILSQLQKYLSK